jgi:hypothetical protein
LGITIHEHQLPTTGLVTMSIRLVSKGGAMLLVGMNFYNSRFLVVRLLNSVVRLLRGMFYVWEGVEMILTVNVTGII